MFEVGFSEMLLIMALALIVLGPEKLPKVAAQIGRWMGRARNMARQFREQLEEEAILEETRPSRTAAPATPASSAVTSAVGQDEDTRHEDYAGAAYEPPQPPAASSPDATPVSAAESASDHGGRGA